MGGTGSCELFCQQRGGDGEGGTKGADTAFELPKCLLLPTEEFQQIFNRASLFRNIRCSIHFRHDDGDCCHGGETGGICRENYNFVDDNSTQTETIEYVEDDYKMFVDPSDN